MITVISHRKTQIDDDARSFDVLDRLGFFKDPPLPIQKIYYWFADWTLSKHSCFATLGTSIAGSFVYISDDPLFEWHGFATVTEPGKKGFSLVVSRVGDWTAKQIDNPPSTLWIWGAPTFGVLCIVPLFCHLVFVATGSGIGPCVPCILEQMVPNKLLLMSTNVRETFGDGFVDSILEKSPEAVIYGRPTYPRLTLLKI